jgi:GNAT superfamily N-acetyltransferase
MPWSDLVAYERGTMWAISPTRAPLATGAPLVAATFGEPAREQANEVAGAMGLADARAVTDRLDIGRRCFVACVGGSIAAYGWVSRGEERIGELERPFHMAADEAYIWDCATLPPHRRKGLYGALLSHMVAALRDGGVERIWIGASLRNRPSVRGFESAGFQPVITLTYLRLLGLRHVWIRDAPTAPPTLTADVRAALNGAHR